MSFVVLDLEWNGSYSSKEHRFVNEIIEFGAVKTDDNLNIIDRFEMLISPQIGKKLCSKVKKLTKITNEELRENGCTFMHAVSEFKKFCGDCVLVTWGTSDILALIENYMYYAHRPELPFLTSYCNVQDYCEKCLSVNDKSSQLGLSVCADMLAINFDVEEQHRAYADAELTLKCMKHFVEDYPIDDFIKDATAHEFYDRLLYKNHFITDINNPEIDKRSMRFNCDACGRQAARQANWKVKNKSFVAPFLCKKCGRKFTGKVSFKKKYDGVAVRKRIVEYVEKPVDENSENKA